MEATRLHAARQWWDRAEWYRALSLTERHMAPEPVSPVPSAGSDARAEKARGRVRAWHDQAPFGVGSLFAERLALDALSERELLALVAEPAESLRARTTEVPDWLADLRQAFARRDSAERLAPLVREVDIDHPLAGCLPALAPLLQRGLNILETTVQALRRQGTPLPVSSDLIPKAFLANIAPTILFQISKPFVLELQIARLQGHLRGETPQARFEHFVYRLSSDRLIVPFLAKYPVLARQLVVTIEQWAVYLGEFLTHLGTDWEAIRATFADDDPGQLVGVDAGLGDRHRGGRSVLLLRFGSGLRLLYKPKPLAADKHFQEMVSWLNDLGAEPALRPLRLLDQGDYGWSEFVAAAPCAGEEQVRRFYQRQGSYLALLYVLDATDLHNENLVAAGEHPMLVDLEALFHPPVHGADPVMASMAARALDRSVWQVGLLPHRIWSDGESLGVDMSGLGGQSGQMNPHRLLSWERPGTDEMRLGRKRAELPVSQNMPRLHEDDVDVVDYRDAIVTGFTSTYRLLCRHRDGLLAEQLPRFANDEIRAFARPTNVYGLLWYESFHPDLLRDALDRDRFFDRLWIDAAQHPYLARVISAEQHDLWRGDIPVFTTSPGRRDIVTSEGEPIADFFDTPSIELVRRRTEQLGEDDLAKQTWIIEASLATLLMARDLTAGSAIEVPARAGSADREQLLMLASAVGKRLDELALQNETGASWLGVGPLDESAWALVPSGTDLYSGTPGIALFLAYLGAVSGDPAPTLLARRAVGSLRAQVRAPLAAPQDDDGASFPTVGAFVGLPSVIYLLTHLSVLWDDPDLLDEATDLVGRLPPLIERDTYLDVLQGSAGCILALLSLDDVRPSNAILEAAIRCGDRLLATAQRMPSGTAWTALKGEPPLGGLSHGTAGIALALLRLSASSGDDRFRRSALSALEFDRSLFVPAAKNWTDLRVSLPRKRASGRGGELTAEPSPAFVVAWCHGAPGIGLARLGALGQLDDACIRDEIDVALSTTKQYGFAMNHSLCHGALGNIELLLTAAQLNGRPEDHEELERATASVVASIESNGFLTGVPLCVETPGLMTGLAGIGYELLRLAEPGMVPAVLLLAPPPRRQRRG
jgi:type 2 lantibiotic biosynthesis protein LanM